MTNRGAEHLGGVEDPPVPLLAADVALLAGGDQLEEPLVPDLVVRVVDGDPVVLVALHVGARQRLRDDLADPASGEPLLDRLRHTGRRSRPLARPSTVLVIEPPVRVYALLAFDVS